MRDERRKAWRFPVLEEHRRAELRVGDASLAVRLVDQSATGFSIECDRHPGVYAGENVWLQTSSGWTEAKVIKIRHEIEVTRIGLERLADVDVNFPSSTGVIKADSLTHETPYSSPWPTVIMVAALLGAMVFLAWIAYDRHGSQHFFELLSGNRSAKLADGAAISEDRSLRKEEVLKRSVKEFGVALMAVPEMVERLGLSEEQLTRLRQIINETLAGGEQLRGSGLAADELQSRLAALHEQATRRAIGLLSSEQSAAWQEMCSAAVKELDRGTRQPQR
jgi:hypothetical protein